MKQTRLLAVLLLLLFLAVQRVVVAWPAEAIDYKNVYPSNNGLPVPLSKSGSGGVDLDGGYGAVIKVKVAPATGAPDWKANGTVSVFIDNVDYTITVSVLYINPSTARALSMK